MPAHPAMEQQSFGPLAALLGMTPPFTAASLTHSQPGAGASLSCRSADELWPLLLLSRRAADMLLAAASPAESSAAPLPVGQAVDELLPVVVHRRQRLRGLGGGR